jgi:hypothetical protein
MYQASAASDRQVTGDRRDGRPTQPPLSLGCVDAIHVLGTWYLVLGTGYLVLRSWLLSQRRRFWDKNVL